MILFPGDKVTATVDGQSVTGVIESFTYDNEAWARGKPDDTANVRTGQGTLIPVPVAELSVVAA
jgi:hypothetical protein